MSAEEESTQTQLRRGMLRGEKGKSHEEKNKMVAYCVCALCVHRRLSSVLQSGLEKKNNNKGLLGGFRYTKEQDMGGKKGQGLR